MKKLLFLFMLLPLLGFSQQNNNFKPEKTAGDYLILSGQMQLAPVAVLATAWLSYKLIDITIEGQYGENNPTYIEKMEGITTKTALIAGSTSVVLLYLSVHYKIKAGKKLNENVSLNAYVNPNGVTFALNF